MGYSYFKLSGYILSIKGKTNVFYWITSVWKIAMNSLLLTRIFFVFSFLVMTSLAMAESSPKDTSDSSKIAENHDCESPDSKCTLIKANSGLQSIFIATASVAPALGQYSFRDIANVRNVKGKANFISGDMSLGWTFIDPRTEHFSHTLLIRGNLQSTLIPANMGHKDDTRTSASAKVDSIYQDDELTRTDKTMELFYKLGVKKHSFMFSVGHKQSETTFTSNQSAWTNIVSLGSVTVDGNSVIVDKSRVDVTQIPNTPVQIGSTKAESNYVINRERITTKGSFVGFGYDYQINEAQNMRLGANVAYLHLNAKRQLSNPFTGRDELLPSDNAKGIKWGIYLQGDMSKLDRYGKLTYTLAYDNVKYDMQFPKAGSLEDKVQEKLQTLSFSVNYIFF